MKIEYRTRANTNGNIYKLVINEEAKTYSCGYFLLCCTDKTVKATKKQIANIIRTLKAAGYTEGK